MVQHSILVIDDDAEIRKALQLMLKKAGYRPLLAEGGQAAIALMEQDEQAEASPPSSAIWKCQGWMERQSSPISTGTIR